MPDRAVAQQGAQLPQGARPAEARGLARARPAPRGPRRGRGRGRGELEEPRAGVGGGQVDGRGAAARRARHDVQQPLWRRKVQLVRRAGWSLRHSPGW